MQKILFVIAVVLTSKQMVCQDIRYNDCINCIDTVTLREFKIDSPQFSSLLDSALNITLRDDEVSILSISNSSSLVQLTAPYDNVESFLRISRIKKTNSLLYTNGAIGFLNYKENVIFITIEVCSQNFFKPTGSQQSFFLINLAKAKAQYGEQKVASYLFSRDAESIEYAYVAGHFKWVGSIE